MTSHDHDSSPVLVNPLDVEGGRILQITINRPEVHNAVDGAAARLLLEAWRAVRDEDSLSVTSCRSNPHAEKLSVVLPASLATPRRRPPLVPHGMDGSRGRVAQLWLLVVAPAPSGYAVQPADSSVAPRCWRQRICLCR